ncbi:MAG: hypothetical protein K1X52_08955 [Pyrinomonadaceae bacterium]|nr:hypothetical protein [Pyrinomonadaceae bacterium]
MKRQLTTFFSDRGGLARVLRSVPWGVWYVLLVIAAALIVISHRPDAVTDPQFWAEDGHMWYEQAYNLDPLAVFLVPEAGYYQTVSRAVAAFSLLFPFRWAPLVLNLFAIAVQAFNAFFIASDRMSHAMPSRLFRFAAAFIYLALPNSYETSANLTNTQWHLGFLVLLIILAKPAEDVAWKIFDHAAVALSAFSGPLCLLLVPIAAIKYFYRREKRLLILGSILMIGAAVQMSALFVYERPSSQPLGASFFGAVRIIAGQWFISPLVGAKNYGLLHRTLWWTDATASVVAAGGLAVLVLAFIWGKQELRLLIIFAVLVCSTALVNPAVTKLEPQWVAMETPLTGSRYWFFPGLTLLVCSVFIATNLRVGKLRYLFVLPALLMIWGFVADWKQPRFKNLDFPAHAREFDNAKHGEIITIPINPEGWEMHLQKR